MKGDIKMIYKIKEGQVFYGTSIGILLLDSRTPFIPGDVANATTYDFPVRFKTVEGFTLDRMYGHDLSALDLFIEAGRELVKDGAKAITGDCGYMALFQKQLAEALDVPVFMSSLLQVPFMSQMLGKDEKVGIIVANTEALDDSLFEAVGIDKSTPLKIKGMQDKENFYKAIIEEIGVLDSEKIEKEVVSVAKEMVEEDPTVKSILLECSVMPPYAAAVQEAVNLPVFDFVTMINYVHSTLIRRRFTGFM